jgi:GAF domain-containing protein
MIYERLELDLLLDHCALEQTRDYVRAREICALLGPPLSGKTAVLLKLLETFETDPRCLALYINLDRYEAFAADSASNQAHNSFFAQLTKDVAGQTGIDCSEPASDRCGGASSFVRTVEALTRSTQNQVVLLIDHFETLPTQQGLDLLRALREVYSRRSPENPYLDRVSVVLASSAHIIEITPEKTSPLSIVQTVSMNDVPRQQVKEFEQVVAGRHGVTITETELDRFYEATGGHRYITAALCKAWIEESIRAGHPVAFGQLKESFVQRADEDVNLRLLTSRIEDNTDILIAVLDLLRGAPVKRRRFQTGLTDLELTGAVRASETGFAIHNPILAEVLRRHFSAEHVIYLLNNAEEPSVVLLYLQNLVGCGPLGQLEALYLKTTSDVVARVREDSSAARYVLEGIARAFGAEGQLIHISDAQMLCYPEKPQLSEHELRLVQHAFTQGQAIPNDSSVVSVAIPILMPADVIGDVLLVRSLCDRGELWAARDRITSIGRFAREALQHRMRQARNDRAQFLHKAVADLSACLEERAFLDKLLEYMRKMLSADLSVIYLYDDSKSQFEKGRASGLHSGQTVQPPPRRKGVSYRMLETGHTILLARDTLEGVAEQLGKPLSSRTPRFFQEEGLEVAKGYPIILGDNRIGVIYVAYRAPHFFKPDEDEAVRALLNQAAVFIGRNRLLQAVPRIAQATSQDEELSPEDHLRTLLQGTCVEVCRLLGVGRTCVWRAWPVGGEVYRLRNGVANEAGKQTSIHDLSISLLPGERWSSNLPVLLSTSDLDPSVHRLLAQLGLEAAPSAIVGFVRSPLRRVSLFVVGIDRNRSRIFTEWDREVFRALIALVATEAEKVHVFSKSEERLERLRTIFAISERSSQVADETELLQQVIESAVRTIPGADAGSVHLLDGSGAWLEIRAKYGYSESELGLLNSIRLQVGQGYAGRVVRDKKPLRIDDFEVELHGSELGNPLGVRSAVIVPMVVRGEPIGTINVDSRSAKASFGESDERWLVTLSNQISIAIGLMRLIRRQETELRTISETIDLSPEHFHSGAPTADAVLKLPDDVFQSTLEKAVNLLSAEMGDIRIRDREGLLVNRACFPKDMTANQIGAESPEIDGIIGKVVREGKSILIEDLRSGQYPEYVTFRGRNIRSAVAAPLTVGSWIMGAINLESSRAKAFGQRDLEALERLATATSSRIVGYVVSQEASERFRRDLLHTSRRAMLKLEFDHKLRFSCELQPSSLGVRHSADPLSLEILGFLNSDDLKHELELLGDYIQMAYRLQEGDLRSEWLPWAKRIGVGFMRCLQAQGRSIADSMLSIQLMGMKPQEVVIQVRTAREHLFLPFELLYIDDWPMVLRHPMVRTVQEVNCAVQETFEAFLERKKRERDPLRFLLIGIDTREGTLAAQEVEATQRELENVKNKVGIPLQIEALVGSDLGLDQITSKLREGHYDLLHIAGDGFFDSKHTDESGIIVPPASTSGLPQVLRVREMAPLLGQACPRFVYLSLCRGAQVSDGRALRSESTLGILEALIHAGVPAVFGYRWDLTAQGARLFAECFYRRLLVDKSLELATLAARREIYQKQHLNEVWLSAVLANQMVDQTHWTAEL